LQRHILCARFSPGWILEVHYSWVVEIGTSGLVGVAQEILERICGG
jgi:hypothetical protein